LANEFVVVTSPMWQWISNLFARKSSSGPAPSLPNTSSPSSGNSKPEPSTKTGYPETRLTTPNKSQRKIKPEAIVLHHSGGSYNGGVSWIRNPASKVSYHCLVARDGKRAVFGEDTDRTWHAGVSKWKGRKDLNSWSIGVSWEGDTYTYPLGEDAIESALDYIVPRMKKWGIPVNMVLDHRIVSEPRKNDIAPIQYGVFIERLIKRLKDDEKEEGK
jgi:N-acetyl-anhydromuramyl-L-alanine amidase AmpD